MKYLCFSPIGFTSPGLFDSFGPMADMGWSRTDSVVDADVVFFDAHSRRGEYNPVALSLVIREKKPVVFFDAWDYWGTPEIMSDFHGFGNWTWITIKMHQPGYWAESLRQFLAVGLLKLYFLRKMQKSQAYPDVVRPLELTLYPDHDFEPVSFSEFSARPYDFCFIGASSPWRSNLVCDLVRAGFAVDYFFPFVRVPHSEWLDRHRQARFFIEADGGGFGSERPYQLITIAAMLKANNDHLIVNDFTHNDNCWKVGDVWGRLSHAEIENLQWLVAERGRCYEIYLNGIAHMKKHFTAKARCSYIVNCMKEVGLG